MFSSENAVGVNSRR